MNKNNAKDYLPLVQALADGKVIQQFNSIRGTWSDLEDMTFNDDWKTYRIRPEPREWWVVELRAIAGDLLNRYAFGSQPDAADFARNTGGELTHVREVLPQ